MKLDDVDVTMNFLNDSVMRNQSDDISSTTKEAMSFGYQLILLAICLFGITGNSTGILLIQSSANLKRHRSSMFLTALALFSCLFLTITFISSAAMFFPHFALHNISPGSCKVFEFLVHWSDFTCAWLVVGLCVDRLALLFSFRWSLHFHPPSYTVFVVVGTAFLSAIFNVWVLVVATLSVNNNCYISLKLKRLYTIFTQIETALSFGLPSIIVIAVNLCIVLKLRINSRNGHILEGQLPIENGPREGNTMELNAVDHQESDTKLIPPKIHETSAQQSEPSAAQIQESAIVNALLLLTTAFVLLTIPNHIYRILMAQLNHFNPGILSQLTENILAAVTLLLYCSHHAVLFYLYIFNSVEMRRQFKPTLVKLVECSCLKPDAGGNI